MTITPVRQGGVITHFIAIKQDVSDRKLAEDQVRRLNVELEQRVIDRTAQLEAANKELESFSYSVSHDLRAPLRAVDGYSRALLEDYAAQLDANAQHYLQRLRAGAERMDCLIRDLLDLSRVGRSPLSRQAVDLSSLAHDIVSELQPQSPGRTVEVVIAEGLIANGDPRLLRVALQNLLSNSWKYTGKHASARIEFGSTTDNGRTTYFVRDDGCGFDMQHSAKLFGAFQRLHPAADFEGTGIGLATVQRIIHRHGGRIWVDAAVEQGATFYFTLG